MVDEHSAWSHRHHPVTCSLGAWDLSLGKWVPVLYLVVGFPEDLVVHRMQEGASALCPQWGRWRPQSCQYFVSRIGLTGGMSSSQTHLGRPPEPAPLACEPWTGRRCAASVSAPCAGGVCASAAAVGL